MLSLSDRALAVCITAWGLLPSLKRDAWLRAVGLERLGAKHGSYDPDTGVIVLNRDLFQGETPAQIRLIDWDGNDPPLRVPCIARATHTALHEVAHALGAGTGLDARNDWLQLSSWVQADDDPAGTARYWEMRPGWEPGPSPWRHRLGCWFTRAYARRSPQEDFADCVTHVALGWMEPFGASANGLAKLRYLRRYVWGETGALAFAAARDRWRQRLVPVSINAAEFSQEDDSQEDEDAALLAAIRQANVAQEREALTPPLGTFRHDGAIEGLMLALGPLLLRAYHARWRRILPRDGTPRAELPGMPAQMVAIQRAAQSYVETMAQRLALRLAEAQADGATATAQRQIVRQVYEEANAARARQMAATERHRTEQAATLAARRATGASTGIWRTTSAQPCMYCAALDGRLVRLGEVVFPQGTRLEGGEGKQLKLDYADVYHPPLHPWCACILEEE